MSETPSRPSRLNRIGALALAAGVAAGAVGVYVKETASVHEGACAADAGPDGGLRAALDRAATGEVAAVRALDTPFDVSALAFRDAEDRPRTLAEMAGRPLLVNLWATWCVPCRKEMPALEALQRQAGGPDFAVVPINVDTGDAEKPKAFYAETGLTALPFYRDATMGVFTGLKGRGIAFGLPVSLLVDRGGCARAAVNGPADWASPDALALVGVLRKSAL